MKLSSGTIRLIIPAASLALLLAAVLHAAAGHELYGPESAL